MEDTRLKADTAAESLATAPLKPAAARALEEAALRRKTVEAEAVATREVSGRGGLDPVRYGDWEVGGLATDF